MHFSEINELNPVTDVWPNAQFVLNTCLPEKHPVVIYSRRAGGVSALFVTLTFLAEKTENTQANESSKEKKEHTNSVSNFSFEFVCHHLPGLLNLTY